MTSFFSTNLDKISESGAEWHVDCGDVVEIETRCKIPMADVTANSMACHPRATYHIAGCSHLAKSMSWSCHIAECKNSIRHIENIFCHILFFVLMQFRLWRTAAFVSSPIHLFGIAAMTSWINIKINKFTANKHMKQLQDNNGDFIHNSDRLLVMF